MTERRLRILFLYDCLYPDTLGGVEHRNDCLGRGLAGLGHEVTLGGWFETEPERQDRLSFLRLPFRTPLYDANGKRGIWASLRFAWACWRVDLRPYDVIETANIPYLHLFPLALRAKLAGKPLVVTWYEYFGPLWSEYKGRGMAIFFRLMEALSAQIGREVCAISPLTQSRFQKARLGGSPVLLAPCGVNLAGLRAAVGGIAGGEEDSEASSSSLLSSSPPTPPLVYAGRLMREKRVDVLIQAVGLLRHEISGPILSIIGSGPDTARLRELVASLGLSEKVIFRGKLPEISDVWREVAQAHVAVQPSAREGFGLFPLEALALGKPVVYCESPDNAIGGIVRHGVEGLCTRASAEDLATALRQLLTDKVLYNRLQQAGLARAELFEWGRLAKEMEQIFYKALRLSDSPFACTPLLDRDFS